MSVLQNDVKPYLLGMLDNKAVWLSEAAQRTVAAWVVMTTITLQDANEKVAIPDEHAHKFFRGVDDRPPRVPEQIGVWIAHYTGSMTGVGYFLEHPIAEATSPGLPLIGQRHREVPIARQRYWATLRIGPLACYVFGHTLHRLVKPVTVQLEPEAAILRIARPTVGAVRWPPSLGLDDERFQRTLTKLSTFVWPG